MQSLCQKKRCNLPSLLITHSVLMVNHVTYVKKKGELHPWKLNSKYYKEKITSNSLNAI
jgi:hypothetical protein